MAVKALDHLGTGLLVSPDDLPQVFGVQLFGERCRTHQVTKHHGELAAFGVGSRRFCGWFCLGRLVSLGSFLLSRCSGGSFRLRFSFTGPDQTSVLVIDNLWLGVEDFYLEVV
jgi:hypothetical protein